MQEAFKSGKYEKLVEGLGKAQGKAKEMADLRMNTFEGDIDILTENVKGLGIELFSLNNGPLRDVVKGMTKWLDENKFKILQRIQDGVKWLVDNGPALVDWLVRVGKMVAVFYGAATAIQGVSTAITIFTTLAEAGVLATVGWAVAIVAALALIVAFWPEISAFFGKVWDGFIALIEPVYKFVKDVGAAVLGPFIDYWKAAFEFVVGAATIGMGLLMAVLKPIAEWAYTNVIEPIGAFFAAVWDGIVAAARAAFDILAGAFKWYYDTMVAIWSPVVDFFAGIWDAVAGAFARVLGPIFEKIEWAVDKVREVGRATLGTDEASSTPEIVSPQDRISKSIESSTTTSKSEVTIKDQTGRARVTKAPAKMAGTTIRLKPTGAF